MRSAKRGAVTVIGKVATGEIAVVELGQLEPVLGLDQRPLAHLRIDLGDQPFGVAPAVPMHPPLGSVRAYHPPPLSSDGSSSAR